IARGQRDALHADRVRDQCRRHGFGFRHLHAGHDRADGFLGNVPRRQPTNATTVHYSVIFTESVTGVATNSFSVLGFGTANGNIQSVSGSGTTYTVTVNNVTGDGSLRLNLNPSTAVQDTAGNIATFFNAPTGYTLDHTPPAVTVALNNDTGLSNSDGKTSD